MSDKRLRPMSIPLKPDDPALWMLSDEHVSIPQVFRPDCYICTDPEFALMGMPLCKPCTFCHGHVAADDTICDDCGRDQREPIEGDESCQKKAEADAD